MRYWLIKFAPFRRSWQQIVQHGSFKIYGVRNAEARNYLRQMHIGDEVLYYHSQTEQTICGILTVKAPAHQDPTTSDGRWVSVDFEPIETLRQPVSLERIKKTALLESIGLVRQPRLSVMPLSTETFGVLVEMGTVAYRTPPRPNSDGDSDRQTNRLSSD